MRARQDLADARRQVRWPWSRRCGELREDAAKVELMDLLAPLAGRSAEEIAAAVEHEVAEFRRHANDDTAIVVLRATHPA